MATEETNSSHYLTLRLKEKYVHPQKKENAGE